MNETQKTYLRHTLTEAMTEWLSQYGNDTQSYEGDELPRTMADAALAVLEANCNAMEYAKRELGAHE